MFPIPPTGTGIATIVGIDPGTEMLGISLLKFDVETFDIVECDAKTYVGSKLAGCDWNGQVYGDRYKRIEAHQANLLNILTLEEALVCACESPFINMRRPQAYGALTEIVCALRHAVRAYDNWKPLYMVEPSNVKKAVNAKGGADKNAVKDAILQISELTQTCLKPISKMDEHSIDALAVSYSVLKYFRASYIQPLYE